jgi:hypothetical protein
VPSFADMVEETLGLLHDWTGQQAQMTSLTSPLSTSDLALQVDDGEAIGRGLVEVDEELVYVTAVDPAGGSATIPPWGRAQNGTTAAAHALGARVTTAPRPPRARVKKYINQAITALYPDLWAVAVDEQTADLVYEYGMPATTAWIIDVEWQTPGFPQTWIRVRSWRLNTLADPAQFPTGRSLCISEVPIGQPIRTVYAAEPTELANDGDDFTAVSGLHAGVADLVVTAAAARLVLGQELARGQLGTVEQSQRADKVQVGASLAASRFLQQTYQVRVAAERRRLLAMHPSRPHFEGV